MTPPRLSDTDLALDDRVRALADLATALRRQGNWADAERHARAAVDLADTASVRAQARAKLELGTLMLLAFEEQRPVEEADPLSLAMSGLDDAARLYESLGEVDFYACLLAIGRALAATGEDPRGLYARVTRDLVQEKWVTAARGAPEVAKRVDYLRGRAFFELGSEELDRGNRTVAADLFDAARELLTASREPDVASIAQRIDELLA